MPFRFRGLVLSLQVPVSRRCTMVATEATISGTAYAQCPTASTSD
ncbi:hypothetical protein RAM_36710 [Amycolatopsis mediterranei S699]|uniref:Uncharacterized protein n=1 Tax=Amycolatopsis mediterranei (strain S699) TaxID=713604 RepID=A0A9R0P3U9_AMYMS|nr:hypothetical protein RAM_36710 [Amycolatopsis mediterranei S699]